METTTKTDSKYQIAIYDTYLKTNKNIFVSAGPGCLGKDTPILMYDGTIKMSQNIKVGDVTMGMDSMPRMVLKVDTGVDELYEIMPQKGDSFICNSQHILTVHSKKIAESMRVYKNTKHKTATIDLPIKEVLLKSKNEQGNYNGLTLIRSGVNLKEKELPIDPYLLGLWLAEGTKHGGSPHFSINSKDTGIVDYLMDYNKYNIIPKKKLVSRNCFLISLTQSGCNKYSKNILREEFKKCILLNKDVFIPKEYLINSKESRLQLLAGLLDGDGYFDGGGYQIITKWDTLKEDILYLVKSLGLAAYNSEKIAKIKSIDFEGEYNSISISGELDQIPMKLKRKKAGKRKQIKNVLHTGFNIESVGMGEWFGFTVDKDNRFLLGDFTVTHNSGKSYTILQMVKKTPFYKKVILTAFNKSIAEELKSKVPSNIEVSTIHSLGFKILRKNVYGRFNLKEIKTYILAKKVIEDPFKGKQNSQKQYSIYLFTIAKLYDLYRLNLADKTPEALQMLADEYSVETPVDAKVDIFNDTIKVIDYISDYNRSDSNKERMIDFTDMLWMAYTQVDKNYFPKYDVVFIDETQDVNNLQREMILNTVSKKGRFVAVGDERQAIYSFMGSNLNSFEKLKNLPNTEVLPLSVSYRCPSSIVDFANSIFPGLESFEGNPEGIIREGSFKDIQEGDMVLCRNNLPLIESFLELLNLNKKSYIMGRDFGKSLTDLINSVDSEDELGDLLPKKIEKLSKRGISNPFNHKSYVALKEKVDIIKLLMDKKNYILDEVSNLFNTLFKDKPNGNDSVTLSTIHKAKGLESERVVWLYPQLIPSQYAKTELELYQEKCLKYVVVTRTISELIIINQV